MSTDAEFVAIGHGSAGLMTAFFALLQPNTFFILFGLLQVAIALFIYLIGRLKEGE